jgi:hypothetical protein
VEALTALLADYSSHVRQTACMALVAINTHPALEALATALLRGDDDLRRAAAESLATHPEEGYAALKDGIGSQDILLRRAAVFGLGRVGEPWAIELLERVQVEDEQWVVRNVAVEILETRKNPDPRIPRSLPPASDAPWVIEFAGRFGMGVSPGQPATDVMLLALKSEKFDEQRGALAYLRRMPSEGVIAGLYHAYFGSDPELREEIHAILSAFASGGIALPDPAKFGLG